MKRRSVLKIGGALPLLSLGSLGAVDAFGQAKPASVTVLTWGGLWGDALQKGVGQRLTAQTGVPVIEDRGSTPDQRITKLKVGLAHQTYDLVQLHDGLFPLAVSQGVLQKINPHSPRLTNLPDVYPQFKHEYWVAQIYSAIGIAYNAKAIKKPPRSWADLWRPEFRGKIVLPASSHSIGLYIIPIGAMAAGKSPKDGDAGFEMFEKMVKLQPIFEPDTDTIMADLVSGEATIGVLYNAQTETVAKRNRDVKWVFPEEGAISISWGTGIAKNAPSLDYAERFLNLTLDPQGQIGFAEAFNYPGTNRKTQALLPPALQKSIVLSDAERSRLVDLDQQYMSEQRVSWMSRWNRIVAGA
ncbi:extracellular solute-binding protein [Pandoraea sp.]|uniref:ABC transporter substrate-binding protein n=1 Tax=Pandoraea sp. TaxID=1883445 RepID=UPI0025E5DF0E|nr:extracellular solute-binding protein [Pandoraea sp.]